MSQDLELHALLTRAGIPKGGTVVERVAAALEELARIRQADPPGLVALRRVASGMPGGLRTFDLYTQVHTKHRTGANWVQSLPDGDRLRLAAALERRLQATDDYATALVRLAQAHSIAYDRGLQRLDRAGLLPRDLSTEHGVAMYLHLASHADHALDRARKGAAKDQGGKA